MANAFTLFGEIRINNSQFNKSIDDAQRRLERLKRTMEAVERQQGISNNAANANTRFGTTASTAETSTRRFRSAIDGLGNDATRTASRVTSFTNTLSKAGTAMRNLGIGMTAGVTYPLMKMGQRAIDASVAIQDMRNQLLLATGDADKANQKLDQMFALAKSAPGVLPDFAAFATGLIGSMKGVDDKVVLSFVAAMGKLKIAISGLDTNTFIQNMAQLHGQMFELRDLREMINKFPVMKDIIAKKFGLGEVTIADQLQGPLRQLVKDGKLTMNEWIGSVAEAINTDPRLANLGDNFATHLAKVKMSLQKSAEPFGKAIGDVVIVGLLILDKVLQNLGEKFAALDPDMQRLIALFGVLIAALGPLLVIFGSLAGAIVQITELFGLIAGSAAFESLTAGLTGAATAAGAFIAGLSTPALLAIAAAVGLLVLALSYIPKTIELVSQLWAENFNDMQTVFSDAYNTIVTIAGDMYQGILDALSGMWSEIGPEWEGLWETIKGVTKDTVAIIVAVVKFFFGWLKNFWDLFGKDFLDGIKAVMKSIAMIVGGIIQMIRGIIQVVIGLVTGDFDAFAQGLKNFFIGLGKAIWGAISAIARQAYEIVANVFRSIVSFLTGSKDTAKSAGEVVGTSIAQGLVDGASKSESFFDKLMKRLGGLGDFKFDIPKFNISAPKFAMPGDKDGAGAKSVDKYAEAIKKLTEETERLGAVTRLDQENANIRLKQYGDLKPAQEAEIRRLAELYDKKEAQVAADKRIAAATENYTKQLNDLIIDLQILNTVSEEEKIRLELSKSGYADLLPAIKNKIVAVKEEIRTTEDFQKARENFLQQVEGLLKKEEKEKTVAGQLSQIIDEMTKKYPALTAEVKKEWMERATAIDKADAQKKAFEDLKDLMKDLGLETENSTTYARRLVDVLSNMEALKQMAKALGMEVEDLRAKLEKAVSEKDRPTFLGQLEEKLKEMQKGLGSWSETWADSVIRGIEGIGDVFANAITQWDGTAQGFFKSLAAGFRSLILSIVAEITKMMVIQGVTKLLSLLGVSIGASAAQTMSPGLSAAIRANPGVLMASGGLVSGAGSGTSDSIPAMLSNGEFVIPARIVKKFGVDFFESIRGGLMPRPAVAMAGGGLASMPSLGSVTNATTNNQNMSNVFNINVASGMGGGQTATMIQQEVLKGLTKVQKRNR